MKRAEAIAAGRTMFPDSVAEPGFSPRSVTLHVKMLKPASQNSKISHDKNTVWRAGGFKGMPLYTLTLEERATCDHGCQAWNMCYGNNMPFATRFDADEGPLERGLKAEVEALARKHPAGFSVRLHVLGDFFSTNYVAFWEWMLEAHPELHIYGYTHRQGEIRAAVDSVFQRFPTRFVILQSDDWDEARPSALINGLHPDAETLPLCPEQSGKADGCLDCGLCTLPNIRGVQFHGH